MPDGAAAFRARRFDEAEAIYSEALQSSSSAEGRAQALCSRAQQRDPVPFAPYRLGCALACGVPRFNEALEAFEEAKRRAPENTEVERALQTLLKRKSEAEGRYDWLEVYEKYFETGPLAVAANERRRRSETGETETLPEAVIAPLAVEPFVGPVRLGHSEERGRGLYVTEDVPKGRLLLCAKALELPALLQAAAGRGWLGVVRSLSRGSRESEDEMPEISLAELAGCELEDETLEEVLSIEEAKEILCHNQ
eukprot:g19166.t1